MFNIYIVGDIHALKTTNNFNNLLSEIQIYQRLEEGYKYILKKNISCFTILSSELKMQNRASV
jgi:hypothetical protein